MFRERRQENSQSVFVATAAGTLKPNVAASSGGISSEKNGENNRLLTRKVLLTLKDNKLWYDKLQQVLAPITPIRNFSSLYIGVPYLFRRIAPLTIGKNATASSVNNWELRYYAQLGTIEEPLINVWISPLMVSQSRHHRLGMEDVYLISLGKRVYRPCQKEYQDFLIVSGNQLAF